MMGAMVAAAAERGYSATRVADVLRIAGVSRSAFYRQFDDKLDCYVETMDTLLRGGGHAILDAYQRAEGDWEDRLRATLARVAELVAAQPAAARLSYVDVYAAGPRALERMERTGDRMEDAVMEQLGRVPDQAGMPRDVVRALLGGMRKIVHSRLRRGSESELAGLVDGLLEWALSYRTPAGDLAHPTEAPTELRVRLAEPRDGRERIMRAVTELVAEKGYPGLVVTEIADRASVSLTTFYDNFESKEEAFLVTLEDAQRHTLAMTLPAYAAEADWPRAVSRGSRAFAAFLAANPASAMLGAIGVWATGPAALELRAQGLDSFRALLARGYELYPDTNPIAAEAIGESVDALLYFHVRRRGTAAIYEIAPTATYITLAPFIGSEAATEVANEGLV
jgi:AcrR family transcriptional regulator